MSLRRSSSVSREGTNDYCHALAERLPPRPVANRCSSPPPRCSTPSGECEPAPDRRVVGATSAPLPGSQRLHDFPVIGDGIRLRARNAHDAAFLPYEDTLVITPPILRACPDAKGRERHPHGDRRT